ncbi:hypothetical protein SeMB42_g04793 [Synchytrium endobioticum]|uniref:Nuclear speckle splicing regulatory protein 1 N-terminal domain-containing protein n=1 Tax=Synchytrium endobioticum TaxID=286115 RepID=A0A507CVR1_9FUNG|nr:hypothetical protein SeMB42_g04793 [Synchytrium endobioticum]TPX49142.1 hypothetical protein SeLEV6574_g01631 [Synchytrium endobioticum]
MESSPFNGKFGLIIPDKRKTPSASQAARIEFKKKLSKNPLFAGSQAFGNNDDDDEEELQCSTQATSGTSNHASKVNRELRAVHSARSAAIEQEHAKALEEDPSVFDYDGVYDTLKAAEDLKKKQRASGSNDSSTTDRKPRYMASLIKAAESRKLDLERAEERKVQREREAEGELYADKEQFVTAAFKARLEEMKRLEEEERRKEALESDVTKKKDLTGFYRDMLDRTTADRVTDINELKKIVGSISDGSGSKGNGKVTDGDDDSQLVKRAISTGQVQLNDSDEIVDKRQLLSAGLNVSRTKANELADEDLRQRDADIVERQRRQKQREEEEDARRRRRELEERKREQERRAQELIETQAREATENAKRRREDETKALAKKMAKKATESDISDAKARYLARMKAKAIDSGIGSNKKNADSGSD